MQNPGSRILILFMTLLLRQPKNCIWRKLFHAFVLGVFCLNLVLFPVSGVSAQTTLNLPAPGSFVGPSVAFVPPLLKGLKVNEKNPFAFDFILDSGHAKLNPVELKTESSQLIKYFLASLTIPDDQLWVNLSPKDKDRIVPEAFGQTEMGRDLLAQDYLLKQLAASLTNPQTSLGKKYWDELHKVNVQNGDALSRVWIVPDRAEVYQNGQTVYITQMHLKVLMDEKYLIQHHQEPGDQVQGKAFEIFKNLILPQIEKEVNEGANFAKVRQVFSSLILAKWYKQTLKQSILNQKYTNLAKIDGVAIADKEEKLKIYEQYLQSFKQGAYDLIKEEVDENSQDLIPRKYFSGGVSGIFPLQITPQAPTGSSAVGELSMIQGTYVEVERDRQGTVESQYDEIRRFDLLFLRMLERIQAEGLKSITVQERTEWARQYFKSQGVLISELFSDGRFEIYPNANPNSGFGYLAHKIAKLSSDPTQPYHLFFDEGFVSQQGAIALADTTHRQNIYMGFGALMESMGIVSNMSFSNISVSHEMIHAWFDELLRRGGNSFLANASVKLNSKGSNQEDFYDDYFVANEILTQLFNARQALRHIYFMLHQPKQNQLQYDQDERKLIRNARDMDLPSPYKYGMSLLRAYRMAQILQEGATQLTDIFRDHPTAEKLGMYSGSLVNSPEGLIFSSAANPGVFDEQKDFQILVATNSRYMRGEYKRVLYIGVQFPPTNITSAGQLNFEVEDPQLIAQIQKGRDDHLLDNHDFAVTTWNALINSPSVRVNLSHMLEFSRTVLSAEALINPMMRYSANLIREYRAASTEQSLQDSENEIFNFWKTHINQIYSSFKIFQREVIKQTRIATPRLPQTPVTASSGQESVNPGGVDFNPNLLTLDIKGRPENFILPDAAGSYDSIQIHGLTPVVTQIVPLNNLSTFLTSGAVQK